MLSAIRPQVAEYTAFLAEIIKADIEVVDERLRKLAAYGLCSADDALISGGAIYRAAFKTAKPVFIQTPKRHPVCEQCAGRARCLEYMEVAVPIVMNDGVIGAIGLLCSSRGQKEQLLGNSRAYLYILGSISAFLAGKAADNAEILRLSAAPNRPVVPFAELERRELERALQIYGDTTEGKRKAAKALGIGLATLYRKLDENACAFRQKSV